MTYMTLRGLAPLAAAFAVPAALLVYLWFTGGDK